MKVDIMTTGKPYDGKHEVYTVEVPNYEEARDWIINHLDTSKEWEVMDVTN